MDMEKRNEALYDRLWAEVPLIPHEAWPMWSALEQELPPGGRVLEIGGGVMPRTRVAGGYFVDLSGVSLRKLRAHGGLSVRASSALPFAAQSFDVVCAFEVLEHIPDDGQALREIARVLRPGGAFFLSVPVDPRRFTYFDTVCGHVRRYEADALAAQLLAHGLRIERWATQPNRFGKLAGALAGVSIKALGFFPRLLVRLKLKAAHNNQQRQLVWRDTDIRESHQEGGLLAIARRL
jgi:SAM-dependent methyltransferase